MKSIIPYEKEIEFSSKIAEITSISLEHEERVGSDEILGDFIVSGDYKVHTISVNKEKFLERIPFVIELSDKIDRDSIKIDISDFTYDIKDNSILTVKIDLDFEYDEVVDEGTETRDVDSLDVEDIEVVEDENTLKEDLNQEILDLINLEEKNEVVEKKEESVGEDFKVDSVIDNGINSDNTYVTYHIHIVDLQDNLESICQKYHVTKDFLHEYNDFDSLNTGDKLLIPLVEDE